MRFLFDRMLYALATVAVRGLFRTVEVLDADRIPRDRPVMLVANHFNGMVDTLLLVDAADRIPRFMAKATLWRNPLIRPLLYFAGLVPVFRAQDQADLSGNVRSFARAGAVLRRGGLLALFPEGITHDRLELAKVRTGAARIAMGTAEEGVRHLTIVPVGLTYDDKLALRTRALVRVGEPIDLDEATADLLEPGTAVDDENRPAVRRLTQMIEERLRAVTPRYDGIRQRAVLSFAAEIKLRSDVRSPGALVPLARREVLAQRLAAAPAEAREALVDALGIYNLYLDVYRLRDDQLVPDVRRRWLATRALLLSAFIAVFGVVMVVGAVVNLVPTLLVSSAGRRSRAPVMKGTVRVLVALVVFPLTWILAAVYLPVGGFWLTLLGVVLWPIAGAVTVGGLERLVRLIQAWRGWLGLRNARGDIDELLEARSAVCRAVDSALAGGPAVTPW